MKPRFFIIIACAIALVTIALISFYLSGVGERPKVTGEVKPKPKEEAKVKVVIADQEIPANTIIDRSMITLKEFEPDSVSKEALSSLESVEGRMSRQPIRKGSLILPSYLYQGVRLAYVVPKDKRAITLIIDRTGAVSYLVNPGDRVDVIGTFEKNFAGEEEMAKLIIQDAEVLATGQQYMPQESQDKPPVVFDTVTLAVTPVEAERLVLGADKASHFRLALRNPVQKARTWTQGATPSALLGRRAKEGKEIEVYKGTAKEVVSRE